MSNLEFNDLDPKTLETNTFFKPKNGQNFIRLMPPWKQGAPYYKEYEIHYGIADLIAYGLTVDGWFAEPCLGVSCPLCAICLEAQKLGKQTNDPDLIALFKKLRKKVTFVSNVLDIKEPDSGVQLYTYGTTIKKGLNSVFSLKGNITHPVTGRNVILIKDEGKDKEFTKYQVMADDVSDISDMFMKKYREEIKDLSEFPKTRTEDELNDLLENVELMGAVTPKKTTAKPVVASSVPVQETEDEGLDDTIDVDSIARSIQELS